MNCTKYFSCFSDLTYSALYFGGGGGRFSSPSDVTIVPKCRSLLTLLYLREEIRSTTLRKVAIFYEAHDVGQKEKEGVQRDRTSYHSYDLLLLQSHLYITYWVERVMKTN